MRKLLLFVLLLASLRAAVTARQQIVTGTNQGVVGVKIALPEFQPATADPKTAGHASIFILRRPLCREPSY